MKKKEIFEETVQKYAYLTNVSISTASQVVHMEENP
jgi:hypothetical protein